MSNSDIQIQNLKGLLASEGWKLIKSELEREVERLTNELLGETGIDPENNEKRYTNNDLMRTERLLTKDIINLPNRLMDQLDPVTEVEVD